MSIKTTLHTDHAPAAIGPYAQAVCAGGMAYLSGQIPLDPKTMTLVEGDISAQAQQVFRNLDAVAKAAGCTLAHAVKLTIYLTDLADFSVVNSVMQEHIPAPYPARATIQIAALPLAARIEVDAILVLPAA